MKPEKDNGGPAFPLQDWDEVIHSRRMETGMSLRDYFAAAALQGALASKETLEAAALLCLRADIKLEDALATRSYSFADAMLVARKEGA